MKIKMEKETYLANNKGAMMYTGNIEIPISNELYICTIKAIDNASADAISAYVDSLKKKSTMKISNDKKIMKKANRMLNKLLFSIDIKVKEIKEIYKQNKKSRKFLFSDKTKITSFVVKDDVSIIVQNLTDEEINMIVKNKSSTGKLIVSATLSRLELFLSEWKPLVAKKEKEQLYQDLLKNFNDLFPVIFGISKECKTEVELTENDLNRCDISGEDWIIELKKPSTPLFNKKNGRNNIVGLSSDLISAENQLSLYIRKANRAKELSKSFTKGILIIGSSNTILTKDQKMTFKMMKEKTMFQILTFDNVTELIEKAITSYK